MTTAAAPRFLETLTTLTLTVPPLIFLRDNFYSLYTVRGSSMEPTLRHGDILLVRKADLFPRRQWRRWTARDATGPEEEEERSNAARVIALDARSDRPIGEFVAGCTYLRPPTVHRPGSVVVFRAPDCEKFPAGECRVKRVVGLGGQIVRGGDSGGFRLEEVPPFGLWVEGDNCQDDDDVISEPGKEQAQRTSIDSRTYGPISKNLVIGVAERVLWPPSRWGSIPCITSPVPRSWWP